MCSLYSSEPSEAAGSIRGDGSPFTPLSTKVTFPMTSLPNRPAPRRPRPAGLLADVSHFLTNFCANGSKPRNTGVVGELVTPRMPNTQPDPGLLHFPQKSIFPRPLAQHLGRFRGASPGDLSPTAPPKSGFWGRLPGVKYVFLILVGAIRSRRFHPLRRFPVYSTLGKSQFSHDLLAKQWGRFRGASPGDHSPTAPPKVQLLCKRE